LHLKKLTIAILIIALCLSLIFAIYENALNKKQSGYPIDSKVYTTLEKTVTPTAVSSTAPKLFPYDIYNFSKYGYGTWQINDGFSFEKRLDLMSPAYTNTSATNTATLLRFFTIADIHITDEETPAQAIVFGYKGGISGGYSPAMLYSTQVLDAATQTINVLHKQKPFDFGISLGDAANANQYNELRWYIDVLDGKKINPDSGVKDDPVPGPLNDYQDEFQAAGLDKSIKWYQTLGNHDHLWLGTSANEYIRQTSIGENILNLGNVFTNPLGVDSRGFYMGAIDGRTPYGDIIGAGLVTAFAEPPKVLAADPNRHLLSTSAWMSEFFNTSSSPNGHGFSQSNIETEFACYSFEPNSNVPIKVIVLDDTQRNDDLNVGGYAHGSLDQERYNWLTNELDKGQAEGKLMIIAAHVPIGVELPNSFIGWSSISPISQETLIAKLHTYPNLIAWIAGHRHVNTVTALKSPDANHPELGFWQIETASLKDFPQQFRTFDIIRNSDNTVSIFAVNVDPAVKEGSLAETSRSYAIAAQQIFKNKMDTTPTGYSYNAELVKQLSTEMQTKILNCGIIKQK
jgi:metallophosphoesterase (TIGR03768 family)